MRRAETVKRLIKANGAGMIEGLLATVRNSGSSQNPNQQGRTSNVAQHQSKLNYLPPARERLYNESGNYIHNPDLFNLRQENRRETENQNDVINEFKDLYDALFAGEEINYRFQNNICDQFRERVSNNYNDNYANF